MMGTGPAQVILQPFAFFHYENISEDITKRVAKGLKMSTIGGSGDPGSNICLQPQLFQLDWEGNWDPFAL
jgi:hypothetical protein